MKRLVLTLLLIPVGALPFGVADAADAAAAPDETQIVATVTCDISAADKTGFDPTQEDGGVSPHAARAKQADYFRAEAACLQARGYRIR